jgi:hypothetical protein
MKVRGSWGQSHQVGNRLGGDADLIFTEQQSFIKQRAHLALQGAGTPVLRGGFGHVPLPRLGAVNAQQQAVVRPAQFVTQCVTNWKGVVKQAHVTQVGRIKPPAKLAGEGLRQLGQQPFAVGSACLASLLKIHNVPPHLPTGLHLHHVHSTQRLLAALRNEAAQGFDQAGEWCCGRV